MALSALSRVLVIVPTYNEIENLPLLVEEILAQSDDLSILIVDDNSPDGTGQLADTLAAPQPERVMVAHRPEKQGIGPAYLAGFDRALAGDWEAVITMDADLSHDPSTIGPLRQAATTADLVIGSRYIRGGSTIGWPLHRRLISRGGGLYARLVLNVPVHDLTSGFKLYRRAVIEQLMRDRLQSDGYGFQIETVYRAIRDGFTVAELPIAFHDRTRGKSKLSRRIVAEAALMVWKLRFARI